MQIVKILIGFIAIILASCGGGGSSSAPPPAAIVPSTTTAPAPISPAPVSKVTLSGQITYDLVPHKEQSMGLNYNNISKQPARGIVMVLLDSSGKVIEQSVTDNTGNYNFSIDTNVDVKVQARAHLLASDQKAWDVKVTDNTLGNALYVMEGSLSSSGDKANQTRNLHAPSGWKNGTYADSRIAAPFAVLSPVYDAIMAVNKIDKSAKFPTLEYRWSTENEPVIGDKAQGQIGTSGYYKNDNAIYLLGDAGRDTDEYDPHVIVHEWGHYFEHNLSRMDSMGGLHSLGDKLDPRLAFSEGWGNALAAMITGDPNYKDSSGDGQSSGFAIDFEKITPSRAGWFNEGSVAAILYDVFDTNDDGNDRISAGFGPIYKSMTHANMSDSQVFTTIFAFSDVLVSQAEINSNDYALLLAEQSIFSSDALGAGENNSGAIASALPVYKEAKFTGEPVEVCSVDDAGNYNKLGNREFIFLNVKSDGDYTLSMSSKNNDVERDPDFNIWQNGVLIEEISSSAKDLEVHKGFLKAGSYVVEAYDFYNINGVSDKRGDACFEFTIEPA